MILKVIVIFNISSHIQYICSIAEHNLYCVCDVDYIHIQGPAEIVRNSIQVTQFLNIGT